MRTVRINRQEAGQRLDKYLAKYLDAAPKSFLYKMLRKKNIKLNGIKAQGDEKLAEGDEVTFYLAEETLHSFQKDRTEDTVQRVKQNRKKLDIVYEDEDILVVNKPVGMLSQRSNRNEDSLVEYINANLAEQSSGNQKGQGVFRAGICNRLDRNTSGLVTAGKSIRGSQWLNALFHDRLIQKYYLCLVHGTLTGSRHMKGYLRKDERTNKVEILKQPRKNCVPIETAYEVLQNIDLKEEGTITLLKVHLITGKSHQIRAHLASIGHPVAGDIKYASDCFFTKNRDTGLAEVRAFMREHDVHRQLLHAWQLVFPEGMGQSETQLVFPDCKEIPEKYQGLRLTGRPPGTFCRVLEELGVSYQELEEKLEISCQGLENGIL